MEDLPTQLNSSVAVIGAGMAGLSCAAHLVRLGIPVTLYDAAEKAGGRTRSVEVHNTIVDNGQHIMLGAYHHTLDLLRLCEVDMQSTWHRQALQWRIANFCFKPQRSLPFPLHLIIGLLSAQGMPWACRWQVLRLLSRLPTWSYQDDVSVQDWLMQQKQSPWLIEHVWQPLCLATMNTPIARASAKRFIAVLRDAVLGQPSDSDVLLAKQDLDQSLIQPILRFIQQGQAHIHMRHRLTQLQREGEGYRLNFSHGVQTYAKQVVLALHPAQLKHFAEVFATPKTWPSQLEFQPITTLYLQYADHIRLPTAMLGLVDGPAQWVFDRGQFANQAGLMAAVISAHHAETTQQTLLQQVQAQLAQAFPALREPPLWMKAISEKRASLSCDVGQYFDLSHIPQGLYLAGDYCHAEYPATIEAAVQSGLDCALQIEAAGISR